LYGLSFRGFHDERRAHMKSSDKSSSRKVIISFHAPLAAEVCVAGTFNGWDGHRDQLKKNRKGLWKLAKSLVPGIYEYRFVVDGIWRDDPSCANRHSNPFGGENCILEV
jgi:1,4-alpha-glucan branching enzyme